MEGALSMSGDSGAPHLMKYFTDSAKSSLTDHSIGITHSTLAGLAQYGLQYQTAAGEGVELKHDASGKVMEQQRSEDVKARTKYKIPRGAFLVNPCIHSNPAFAFDQKLTTINRILLQKLNVFPHSAGLKNRSFPGHKEVTSYLLGVSEPGSRMNPIKVVFLM
jgi:hypothetical protein